ncbi:hypothetical protein BS162P1_00127 [Bacteroides phage BS162P1]|nr:hypothetical protein BS162P1_00127 [Bacteroides phage BS162P1]
MDSNLKVGSNNAGLFIGNTEILRGGVQNITIGSYGNLIIVINRSNVIKRISFDYREDITLVPTQVCSIYSPGEDAGMVAIDNIKCNISSADILEDGTQTFKYEANMIYENGNYFAQIGSVDTYDLRVIEIME